MSLSNLTLLLATIATGLVAGLFFAWTCSISPGFAVLADKEYISAMQSINKAIVNPLFITAFLGAFVFLVCGCFITNGSPRFVWLASAFLIYLAGVLGVTFMYNVPLNNLLDTLNTTQAGSDQIHAYRIKFEGPWTNWNTVRTCSSLLAFALTVVACLQTDLE